MLLVSVSSQLLPSQFLSNLSLSTMLLSRLRRCFSSKPSSSTAYRPLYTPPIANRDCALPKPLPVSEHDRNRSESPPPPLIPIGGGDCHGGSGNEEKTSAMLRIENELRAINEVAPTHCSFGPVGTDIYRWEGIVIGPASSCYEGGIFRLSIQFSSDYPLTPPLIKFLTKIYHPYVEEDGTIYIDILKENWSSALTVEKVLLSICSILSNPIPLGSIIDEASSRCIDDWLNYCEIAREWTKRYAMETN